MPPNDSTAGDRSTDPRADRPAEPLAGRLPDRLADPLPDRLRERLVADHGGAPADVRVVRAPYRFCPIGAHVDHQDGEVTGFALDRGLYLAYVPVTDTRVTLRSFDYPGVVETGLDAVVDAVPGDWGNYMRGAIRALGDARPGSIRRGLTGVVGGEMSPGGVSTSAALGVACLLALEDINGLQVSPGENVALDQAIENGYLGLRNGILDQSVILRARAGQLLHLDCRSRAVAWHPRPDGMPEPVFLAVYSGVDQALVTTGYNQRVEECRRAASELLAAAGRSPGAPGRSPSSPPRLRDVPEEIFDTHIDRLTGAERRRAEHYIGEMRRVRRGVAAWRAGDIAEFGRIVTETGLSSIHSYECGSPELIRLFEILAAEIGVHGARFSGAGFRGYCMALVEPDAVDRVSTVVRERYLASFPGHRAAFHLHACRWADGAGLIR